MKAQEEVGKVGTEGREFVLEQEVVGGWAGGGDEGVVADEIERGCLVNIFHCEELVRG